MGYVIHLLYNNSFSYRFYLRPIILMYFLSFLAWRSKRRIIFILKTSKSYTTSNIIICCIKYAFLRHFYLYKEIMSTHNLNVAWSMFNWYTWNGSTNTLFCFQCIINMWVFIFVYFKTVYSGIIFAEPVLKNNLLTLKVCENKKNEIYPILCRYFCIKF